MKRESLLVESTPAPAGKSTTNAHGGGNLDFAGRPWPDSPTVDSRTRIAVFVASPGDTQEERRCLQRVVAELNRGVAASAKIRRNLPNHRANQGIDPRRSHETARVLARLL